MHWEVEAVADLNVALNEATICAIGMDPHGENVELFVEVLALPAEGPIDPDPRRVIVLTDVSSLEVLTVPRDRPSGHR